MANKEINRKEFLNLTRLALLGSFLPGTGLLSSANHKLSQLQSGLIMSDAEPGYIRKMVRVGIRRDTVHEIPSLSSPVLKFYPRDQLVPVLETIISPHGPAHNPRWYRVPEGYMHSAHLPTVHAVNNPVVYNIQPEGEVFEVTVPFTRSYQFNPATGWVPLYRLYYESTHWVTGLDTGPDGGLWYIITDDLLKVKYMVPAAHMRRVAPEEFEPISPNVTNKRIEISLRNQVLTAFEGENVVFETKVSTGIPTLNPVPGEIPTETPRGEFNIHMKTPVRHMGNGNLTDDINAYELPGVPWVGFFADHGVAFHGTYWHDNYGGRMSKGCVNMRSEESKWLFRWTTPVFTPEPGKWHQVGHGTPILVKV